MTRSVFLTARTITKMKRSDFERAPKAIENRTSDNCHIPNIVDSVVGKHLIGVIDCSRLKPILTFTA
jgi:hypothetical protein